jgi:hypothetical protein
MNIVGTQAQVMDSGTPPFEKTSDGRILGGWLEEFDSTLTTDQHRYPYPFVWYLLDPLDLQPQSAVGRHGLVDRSHRDPYVIDLVDQAKP